MSATSTPWYKADIVRGLLLFFVTQLIAHSRLANLFTSDQISAVVDYCMQGISYLGVCFAAHARFTKPVLPITGTKLAAATDAALANAQVPQPVAVAVPVPVLVVPPSEKSP